MESGKCGSGQDWIAGGYVRMTSQIVHMYCYEDMKRYLSGGSLIS
jgi:hypothetical protein